jgi:hypothetical protein
MGYDSSIRRHVLYSADVNARPFTLIFVENSFLAMSIETFLGGGV